MRVYRGVCWEWERERKREVESKAVCKQINEADRSGGGKTSYKIIAVRWHATTLKFSNYWILTNYVKGVISSSQLPNPSWLLQQIFIPTQTCTRVGWGQGIFLEVIVILSYLNIFSVIFIIFKFNFY